MALARRMPEDFDCARACGHDSGPFSVQSSRLAALISTPSHPRPYSQITNAPLLSSRSLFHSLLRPRPPLNVKSRIRLPQLLHLPIAQRAIHLLHIHQFLHRKDLSRDIGRDRVVYGLETAVQTQGFEDAGAAGGETDGGAEECDAEEAGWGCHCG